MTRRELTQAVIQSAKNVTQVSVGGFGKGVLEVSRHKFCILSDLLDALDACTEPDLAALNAAVAEAVEEYVVVSPSALDKTNQPSRWVIAIDAINARRAALAPKPRYEVNLLGVYDHKGRRFMQPEEVAALLNEKEKP
jgi:hypothetical protein